MDWCMTLLRRQAEDKVIVDVTVIPMTLMAFLVMAKERSTTRTPLTMISLTIRWSRKMPRCLSRKT